MNLHQGVSSLPESCDTRKIEADVYTCFLTAEELINYFKNYGTKLSKTNGRDNGCSED